MTSLRPAHLALVLALASPLVFATAANAQSKTYTNGENNAAPLDTTGNITLTVNDANVATQSGVISGTGNVSKAGDGSLFLSGLNGYFGTTSVDAGILFFPSPNAFYGADTAQWNKLTVASGATVAVDASSAGFSSAQITTLLNSASFASNTSSFEFYFADNHSLTQNTNLSETGTPEVALTLTGSTPLDLAGRTLTLGAAANQNLAVSRALGGGHDGAAGVGAFDPGAPGGAGGSLVINQGNVTFNLAVNITGGAGGSSGANSSGANSPGGTGGAFTLSAGEIFFGETVSVSGGDGGANGLSGGAGGSGGSISLTGATVTFDQDVRISGGKGGDDGGLNFTYGGTGGAAGSLNIIGGTVAFNQALDLIGGNGGDGGSNSDHRAGVGGNGGSITLSDGVVTFAGASSVNLSGGLGGLSVGATNFGRNASGALGTFTLSGGMLQLPNAGWLESSSTFIGNFAFTGGTFKTTDTAESLSLTGSSKLGLALANASVTADRTLDLAGSLTYSGVVAGSGGLVKTGSGTLTLSGTNTYSGGTTVSAGTLAISSDANLGASAGALAVTSGATFNAGINFQTNRAVTLDGAGTQLTTNNGELVIGSAGTGSLALTNDATASTYGLTLGLVGGTGTVDISSGATITVNNVTDLSSTSTLNLNTGGTLTTAGLSGSGTFNLAGGTLRANGALSTSLAATLTNASSVDTNGYATTLSGILSGSGSLAKTGAGTLTLSADNTYAGVTTISAGTLQLGTGGSTGSLAGNVANSGTLIFKRALSQTYGGVVSGTGSVVSDGGVVSFSAAQTYTGATAIKSGAYLVLPTAVDQGLSVSTTVDIESGGTLDISNRATTIAGLTGAGNVYSFGGSSGQLTVNTSDGQNQVFSGTLGSSFPNFALTKAGPGTLTLSGTNTYSGGTTVSAGTLTISSDANLGASSGTLAVTSGATLATGGDFRSNRAITLDGSGTHLGNNGELIIGNGDTGSLALSNNATAATFNLTLGFTGGGGTVDISSGSAVTVGNVTSLNTVASTLNLHTGGTLTTAGLSGSGTFNLSGGTLKSSGALTSSLPATLSNASTIDTNGYATTLSGVLSGTGSLTKAGAGTLTLSGANTYTGATTISAGTLALGAEGSFAASSGLALGHGGILDLTAKTAGFTFGVGQTLSGNGTINLASGQTLTLAGTLAPGNSPGLITVDGNLGFAAESLTAMELGGLVRGVSYDALNVTGALTFGGTLSVSLINAFAPAAGDSFQLFNATSFGGTFGTVNLPTLAGGLFWDTTQLHGAGLLAVSAIPEPGAFAIIAGLVALGFSATRRRRRAVGVVEVDEPLGAVGTGTRR